MLGKKTLAFVAALVLLINCTFTQVECRTKSWWETASFYQIYPRSFKDSDGDGVGDLMGVTSKLAYLKEIGVSATWLSPFLKSPMADFGYDISNFTAVDPVFGTMADFEELMRRSQQLDIKIILDFVPNHSSDECEWFIKSANKDPEFKDFYVWHPGKIVNGTRMAPNNWVSVFRGSAWQWHVGRQEYYLHQFHRKQPDLNYRHPKVREVMNDVLRFWLDKGVHGFRVDAIYHAFEIAADSEGNYPDEPLTGWTNDPDDYGYCKHIYTVDQPETPHLVYEWHQLLHDYQKQYGGVERILMIETWSPLEIVMEYYGNATADGAQIPFNFQLISHLDNSSDAQHYAQLINGWFSKMPAGRTANWVIGNHDKNRVGSRFGTDRIDMFNMMLLTLPGCSITYNGEEIGMTDVWISWQDTTDPQACNGAEQGYEYRSRDPARTPFQWNDEVNAGFSTANKTWLPVGSRYRTENVMRQRGIPLSHLNIFRQLQSLREENTLRDGATEVKAINHDVLAIRRFLQNDYTYITLMNIFDSVQSVDLSQVFPNSPAEYEYVVITDKSFRRMGDKVSSKNVLLLPKEAVVLRSSKRI